ncbi:Enoyl-CoA hydratase/carnithine racemase [Pseudonocardia oroxyli]|uniref:Enoyl-CoA hydratase/carnithine racemase n=1 Tax=Pseudonocardia oroxyli TaxID=366584 RepID=A0A1G8D7V9_PSEOR|nr:Enoyl-CoA hydratase/carnithine racemase [Pseudonocardia oroxyli]
MVDAGDRDADERRQHFARSAYDTLMNLNKPTIAVVNGPAIGGGAVLAACCDLRIGSARTTFHLPEVNIVRCGGARHYMRLLPQGVLRQMYFTGRPLTAHDSHRFGLLNDVVEQGEELHRALELAEEIATKSPLALRTAKEALNAIEELSVLDGYALEQSYSVALGRSADAKEAAAAFLEKRPPAWTGV